MAHYNWARMSVATGGTGNLALAAVTGFPTIEQAAGTGAPFWYAITDVTGRPMESGIGQLSAPTTMVRTDIRETFVGGVYDTTTPAAVDVPVGAVIHTAAMNYSLLDEMLGAIGGAIGVTVQGQSVELDALAGLSSAGLAARVSAGTWAARTITGTAGQITVTNGNGAGGNPTLALASPVEGATFNNDTLSYVDRGNAASGTMTLNWAQAFHQRVQRTGNFTFAFSNVPAAGAYACLLLELVNGGAGTITWPTIQWVRSDGSTTTSFATYGVQLQATGTDFVLFWTRAGSGTVYGRVVR